MNFEIKNRIIKANERNLVIGDNADYVAHFNFDTEWESVTKTARFIACNGSYKDVLIENNICKIPCEVLKCGYVKVGVYSAEMTTTECEFTVLKSIKDETGNECEPTPSIYEQLTKHLDDLYQAMPNEVARYFEDHKSEFKGDKGDKGDKGEDGAIKFIPVNELPTENIDETAIYSIPSDDPENQNKYKEYIYKNGDWELFGTTNVKFDADGYAKIEELESYLKKNTTTQGNRLYASQSTSDGSIVQTTVGYSTSAVANMVAVRESGGALNVGTPTKTTHATTKDYVDEIAKAIPTITLTQKENGAYKLTVKKG